MAKIQKTMPFLVFALLWIHTALAWRSGDILLHANGKLEGGTKIYNARLAPLVLDAEHTLCALFVFLQAIIDTNFPPILQIYRM